MQNLQEIRDFYVAAYLFSIGIKLESHKRINGSTIFIFQNDESTNRAIENYYSMSTTIQPLLYGNAIKAVKTIVHSYERTISESGEQNNVKQYRGTKRA